MTVKELIEKLKKCPENAEVVTLPSNAACWSCSSDIYRVYIRPGKEFYDNTDRIVLDIGQH